MEKINYFKTVINQPRLLRHYRPIILLSHMRANTSLIGHIIGSHPQINGYYEQHIGYYSWKSFVRQRLLFAQEHKIKPNSHYFFDKVLHSEHFISTDLINKVKAKVLISVRSPETTIPSIINLYKKVDPDHDFCTIEGAIEYYIKRLEYLINISKEISDFYYYDADHLREGTSECLESISAYLGLQERLSPQFEIQRLTGVGNTGDHSGNLNAATVKRKTTDYSDFNWNNISRDKANDVYYIARKMLGEA